ncbi:MAG: AsmA family protein [Caulobacterales bacterium]|uniref:AsmA family protein n=1 Tax=Glycocaulis sp. TaxID=1969725 RepID=UPI003FA03722
MRRLLVILLVLAGLAVAAALLAPLLFSPENWRGEIEQRASQELGREVSLNGDIALSVLPSIQIRAADASIGNADGFGEEPFAELGELRLGLALWPLFSSRVEVSEFVLVDPVIRLRQNAGGNNWTFASAEAAASPESAGANEGFRRPGALPLDGSFSNIRIENGQLSYSDGSETWEVSSLNLALQAANLDGEAQLSGDFVLEGETINLTAVLGAVRPFMEGRETPISLEITSSPLTLSFDGNALESAHFDLAGNASIEADLPGLARLAGQSLPESSALRRASASGRFTSLPGRLQFEDARFTLDDITATGALTAQTDRERPFLTGQLAIPVLDLNPYMPEEEAGTAPSGQTEWSTEEIDLAALRLVDADLRLSAGQLIFGEIEVSEADLRVQLANGRLVADLSRFGLYGGAGSGQLVVNARNATLSYTLNARLDGLQTQPFLGAAADFSALRGLGNFTIDLASSGASTAAIMQSLTGNGNLRLTDGAIEGFNLAQILRGVQNAIATRQLPQGFGEAEETDFSELGGSFAIRNGVLTNDDLSMLSPLLRVTGAGEFNLAEQSMNYRISPRAVASLAGQGGTPELNGIAVPVRLTGSFANPSFSIDFEAVARELARGQARGLIDRLLPGQQPVGEGEEGEDQPAQPTPADLLRGLLDRQRRSGNDEQNEGG